MYNLFFFSSVVCGQFYYSCRGFVCFVFFSLYFSPLPLGFRSLLVRNRVQIIPADDVFNVPTDPVLLGMYPSIFQFSPDSTAHLASSASSLALSQGHPGREVSLHRLSVGLSFPGMLY